MIAALAGCHLIYPFDLADRPAVDAASDVRTTDAGADVLIDAPAVDAGDLGADIHPPDLPLPDVVSPDLPPPDAGPTTLCAVTFGGTGEDEVQAVALDSSGNIYLAGHFSGTISASGGSKTITSKGGTDCFLISLFPSCAYRWGVGIGDKNNDVCTGLAVDSAGNRVYVSGTYMGSISVGSNTLPAYGIGVSDVMLASFDLVGKLSWAKGWGSSSNDHGRAIAVAPSGGVVFVGDSGGPMSFDATTTPHKGQSDIFVARVDTNGKATWVKAFGDINIDHCFDVAVDSLGQIYLAGAFDGALSLGGLKSTSQGLSDLFVGSLKADGGYRWLTSAGSKWLDRAFGVVVHKDQTVYITGQLAGSATIGGTLLTNAGGFDGFVASLKAGTGSFGWAVPLASSLDDQGNGIAVDTAGNVVATGFYSAPMKVGTLNLPKGGLQTDIFVIRLSAAGSPVMALGYGGTGPDWGWAVTTGPTGGIFAGGKFGGSVTFGTAGPRSSNGGADAFIVWLP